MSVRKLTAQFDKPPEEASKPPAPRPRGKTYGARFGNAPAPPPRKGSAVPLATKPRSNTAVQGSAPRPTPPARPERNRSGTTVSFAPPPPKPAVPERASPLAPPKPDTRTRAKTTGTRSPVATSSSNAPLTSHDEVAIQFSQSRLRSTTAGSSADKKKPRKSTWAGKTWNRLRSTTAQSRAPASGGGGGGGGDGGKGGDASSKKKLMLIIGLVLLLLGGIATGVLLYFKLRKSGGDAQTADQAIDSVASKVLDLESSTALLNKETLGIELDDVVLGTVGDESITLTNLQVHAQKDFTWDEFHEYAKGTRPTTERLRYRMMEDAKKRDGLLGDLDLDAFADFAGDGRPERRMPGVVFKGTCSILSLVDITATVGLFIDQPVNLREALDFRAENVSLVLWVDVDRTFKPKDAFPILKQADKWFNTTALIDNLLPMDLGEVVISSTPFTLRLSNNTDVRRIKRGVNYMSKVRILKDDGFEDLKSLLEEEAKSLISYAPQLVMSFPMLQNLKGLLGSVAGPRTLQLPSIPSVQDAIDALRNTTLSFTFNDLSLETDSIYIDSTEGVTLSVTGFDRVTDLSISTGFKITFANSTGADPLYVRGWGRTIKRNEVRGDRLVYIGGVIDIPPGTTWDAPFGKEKTHSVSLKEGKFEAHMVLPCGIREQRVIKRQVRLRQATLPDQVPQNDQHCGLELESLVFQGAGEVNLGVDKKYAVTVAANSTGGEVVFFVEGAALTSTDQALAIFDSSNQFPLDGQLTEAISFDVAVSTADALFTRPDGRPFERGVTVRGAGTRLQTGTVREALAALSPQVDNLPFQVYAYVPVYDLDTRRWTVSLSTQGLKLGSQVVVEDASFGLNGLATQSVDVDAYAKIAVAFKSETTLEPHPLDLYVNASWRGAAKRFQFAGGLLQKWEQPFGLEFVDIVQADVSFDYAENAPLKMDIDAWLEFRTAAHRVPVKMIGKIDGDKFRVSVKAVAVEEISADLSNTIIGNGFVSAVFTNHEFLDELRDNLRVRKGISLYAEAFKPTHKALDGSLSALSEQGGDIPVHIAWRLSVYLPIFGGTEAWEIALFAAEIPLMPKLTLRNNTVAVKVTQGGGFSADLSSSLVIALEKNDPIQVDVSASVDSEKNRFDFLAVMNEWKNPFGMDWWSIGRTEFAIVLDYGSKPVEKAITLKTSATFTFTAKPITVNIEGGIVNGDAYFVARSLQLKSLTDLFCTFLGEIGCNIANNEFISGLDIFNRPFDIAVTTGNGIRIPGSSPAAQRLRMQSYQHNRHLHRSHPLHTLAVVNGPKIARGLNIFTDLKLNGPILGKLVEVFGDRFKNSSFTFGTAFPVFDPLNINEFNLRFATPGFRISDTVDFMGVELDVTPFKAPPEFSVGVEIAVMFPKNTQPVYFSVSGALSPVEFTIGGSMVGLWRDAFGLNGFTVGNAAIELGIAPGPVVSRIGLSVEMHMGEIKVFFAGRATANLANVYIEARIEKLSMRNFVEFWNNLVPTKYELNEEKVPNIIEFRLLHFKVAPTSGSIQGVTYQAGFGLAAKVIFFERITASAAVGSFKRDVEILGKTVRVTDFGLDVEIPFGEIINAFVSWFEDLFDKIDLGALGDILKSVGLAVIKGVKDIARIDRFAIKNFRLFDVAQGKLPTVELDIVILGKKLELKVNLDFRQIGKSILALFKEVFKLDKLLPECVIDANCKNKSKPRCDHTRGWRCVDKCRGLFKKGILGTGCW